MVLSSTLAPPNIESILGELELQKRVRIIKEIIHFSWYHEERSEVVIALSQQVAHLVDIDLNAFEELYDEGINCESDEIKWAVAASLGPLAIKKPELFEELFYQGINNREMEVKKGTFATLEQLADLNPEGFILLCEEGIQDPDLSDHTQKALGKLARINPQKFVSLYHTCFSEKEIMIQGPFPLDQLATVDLEAYLQLYQEGIEEKSSSSWKLKQMASRTIGVLALIDQNLFIKLYRAGVSHKDSFVRHGTAPTLKSLAVIDKKEFLRLYHQFIQSDDASVRQGVAQCLEALADFDPADYQNLCQEGMRSKDPFTRFGIAGSLGPLARVNQQIYLELYVKGTKDDDPDIRKETSATLVGLAAVDPKKFLELCEKGIDSPDNSVREGTTKTLVAIPKINVNTFLELYEKSGICGSKVRESSAAALASLPSVDPSLYLKLFLERMNQDKNDFSRVIVASTFGAFIKSSARDQIIPIEDEGRNFFRQYLQSKYVQDKSSIPRDSERIVAELTELVQNPPRDYPQLSFLLEKGEVRDLEEMIECSNIELKDHVVLKRLTSGGWSNIFLIANRNIDDPRGHRVLKVPCKNLSNPNVEAIIRKNGTLEKTLAIIATMESDINNLTANTSLDNFPNFEYRPLPQFFGSQMINYRGRELPALIYEFISGETLKNYFPKASTNEEKIELLTRAAYCLNYIHLKGFTHNDIKNDNFMVGKNKRVYLLDLAFSRLTDSETTIKGERLYTAPERILGQSSPTEKSDQYSFGAMAYKLLTGKAPIDFGNNEEEKATAAQKVQCGEVRPDFAPLRSISPSLAPIIERCMEFHPQERYESMQQVENELHQLLKD